MTTRIEVNTQTGEVTEVELTQEELDAAVVAKAVEDEFNSPANVAERDLTSAFSVNKLFKAKCISDLAFRLGKLPGQLTTVEIGAERDRIKAIYKALL